jgi:hypothetical protein
MNLIKHLSAAAMLIGLIAAPGLASAEQTTVNLNVRSGPGPQYGVIDVLSPGVHVNVTRRSGSWCYLDKPGQDGWVSCTYLTADDAGPRPGPDYGGGYGRDDDRGRPDVNLGFSIPGFSFHVGPGGFGFGPRPGYDRRAQVCFYEDVNYRGRSLCMSPGQSYARLTSWNDQISSIRIRGRAEALVCEDWNYRGRCITINRDRPDLGRGGNDRISSIRVR